MPIRPTTLLALALLAGGCGSSPVEQPSSPPGVPLSFTPRASIHEGELASNPGLRADLSRQQLISYLESSSAGSHDTGSVGQDVLPFHCPQPLRMQINTRAPHLAGARILDSQGKLVVEWAQGSVDVNLPAGDYQLELTSTRQQDAHLFVRTRPPAAIRPLTTTPGVYISEISETPQMFVVVPLTLLIGASSDGSSRSGIFGSEADFQDVFSNPGPNLSLAVHQYFANGGTNLKVVSCASSSVADLNTALNKLSEAPQSYQLALADLYQLPLEQADALAQQALTWAMANNSLLFLDIPEAVNSVPLALTWRQQRPQLTSSQCLLYWPGLNSSNSQPIGSSSSVLGLLDALASQSGPGTSPLGRSLQASLGPEVACSPSEIASLTSAQINPVGPSLTLAPGILLQSLPNIPDLGAQQKLLTITESIRTFMLGYVFSPNNANTWETLTQGVSATLLTLYQQGILAGSTASDAYQVVCGIPLTMSGLDVLNGDLNLAAEVLLEPGIPPVQLTVTQAMMNP